MEAMTYLKERFNYVLIITWAAITIIMTITTTTVTITVITRTVRVLQ